MDLNEKVNSPCRRTNSWGFVGFYTQGKKECSVPIGVYGSYRDGKAVANTWMGNTPNAVRWEASPLYEEIQDEQA